MSAKRNSRGPSRTGVPGRTDPKKRGKPVPATSALQLAFYDQKAWQKWLHKNHATEREIWIQMAKVASGIKSVTHPEALEIALCYGWIDGRIQPLNNNYTLRRFIPRRKDSIWSQINRAKALQLIEQGQMQPAGFAAIEQAKANGRWDAAYQPTSDKTIPPDLEKALSKSPKAAAAFKSLDRVNRYAIVFRLQTAKKPETRAARLAKFVAMLERGEKLI
jgi:uncharacterized protein YdeI (YjbR/CyaY-like superfamily)